MSAEQANSPDEATELLIIVAVLVASTLFFGWLFHDPLIHFLLWLARWKLQIQAFFIPDPNLTIAVKGILSLEKPSELTYTEALQILGYSNRYIVWFFVLPVTFIGFRLLLRDPGNMFRRNFDMMSLLDEKAKHFDSVRPVVGLNLIDRDPERGAWRSAEDYISFALRHQLIQQRDDSQGWVPLRYQPRAAKRNTPVPTEIVTHRDQVDRHRNSVKNYNFDLAACKNVFIQQLGPCITNSGIIDINGWRRWPKQHRALMVAFMIFRWGGGSGVGREFGFKLLAQYNDSFYHPDHEKKGKPEITLADLNMSGVDYMLCTYLGMTPPKLGKNIRPPVFPPPREIDIAEIRNNIFSRHAYLNTVMIRLLESARERGILTTSRFIWLKPTDRTLFYTLNNVGRNNQKNATGFCEGGGSIAHFMVEESLNSRCITPEIGEAVYSLHKALASEGWLPEKYLTRVEKN